MSSKFAQGTQKMQEASKGAGFKRTTYFKIEDKESAILRFLTEANPNEATPHLGGWITVLQHQGVRTRPRPDWIKDDARWPERWGCICRLTKAEALPGEPALWTIMDDKAEGEGCYVCLNVRTNDGKADRASGRGWALACLREEIREDGILQGYKDKTREVEDTDASGNVVTTVEKAIVVVNLGWKNFFSTLDGFAGHYGTVVDRDYLITRKGEGTATQYQIVPLDPIPGFDLRNPDTFAKYHAEGTGALDYNLDDIIEDQARWAYQRRWFDPTYTPPKKDDASSNPTGGAPASQQEQRPSGDVDADAMQAMADRVQGRYQPPTEGDQPSQEQPQPAAQAPAQAPAPAGGGLRNIE